jgi:hypothetical protein
MAQTRAIQGVVVAQGGWASSREFFGSRHQAVWKIRGLPDSVVAAQNHRSRSPLALARLAPVPGQAFAQGEEALLVPVGTLAAVATDVLFVCLFKLIGWTPVVASVLAASAAPLGLVPAHCCFPSTLTPPSSGSFVVGGVPSLLAGGLIVWLAWRFGAS